jgi:organic radical activating enzyme
MDQIKITHLFSGGIITNYYCTSQCGHCLYGCSPKWEKKYLEQALASKIFTKIKQLGCSSIHVGGGEPFLNIPDLKSVLSKAKQLNVKIEYIETNSSWFIDQKNAREILSSLKKLGTSTLLISMSPFHNEYIPFKKVKNVIRACQAEGISIIPWIEDFYAEINSFDDNQIHGIEAYQKKFGKNYLSHIPSRYWIHFGGRALETFRTVFPPKALKEILQEGKGCRELIDTTHFHIDLFGNYIPGLCTGLAIQYQDLVKPLDLDKYFFLNILFHKGILGLHNYARDEHGFIPRQDYLSKCDLCLDIRIFLVRQRKLKSVELQPLEFYTRVNLNK